MLQRYTADSCSGPFSKAAPQPHRSQPVLGSFFMLSNVQDFALVFVKLYTVLPSPFFQPVQVSPYDSSPFSCVHFTIQFSVIRELGKGGFNPIIQVTVKMNRVHYQCQSLGNLTFDRLPA